MREVDDNQHCRDDLACEFPYGSTSYGAYVPDLPGCVAVGETRDEVLALIREAVRLHVDDLQKSGQPVPPPSTTSEVIDVHAA